MNADQEIELLDTVIERHMTDHPGVWGVLRISPTVLRACTKSRWAAHN